MLVIGIFLSWRFWEELHGTQGSHSTTIRNVGLVVGGVIAVLLAVWRSTVAERQTATAQQGLLNERYQKGAEMLGSGVLSVRLGGIYALQRLAEEHPEQYHVQIMRLLCAFVRHPTKDDGGAAKPDEKDRLREDVQAVMTAIGTRSEAGIALEKKANLPLDLHGADLSGAWLADADLSGAWLASADLSNASLYGSNLARANLYSANLSRASASTALFMDADLGSTQLMVANLASANLSSTNLDLANLSKALLTEATLTEASLISANLSGSRLALDGQFPATGLTQTQLDQSCADADDPPSLTNVVDAKTGEPLVWHHRPCEGAGD